MTTMLPPKKKAWLKGQPQIGVFLRTAEGSTIECVHDHATADEQAFVVALIRGVHFLPGKLVMAVRAELARAKPIVPVNPPGIERDSKGTPVALHMPTNKQAPRAYRAPKKGKSKKR